MNRLEAIARLKELQNSKDPEEDHFDADRVLCDLLNELGYMDVVDEWVRIDRWYA